MAGIIDDTIEELRDKYAYVKEFDDISIIGHFVERARDRSETCKLEGMLFYLERARCNVEVLRDKIDDDDLKKIEDGMIRFRKEIVENIINNCRCSSIPV